MFSDINDATDRLLAADLASAAAALRATAIVLPADEWRAEVTVPGPPPFPKSQVLLRRLELRHVDLGIGYTGADRPKTFTELDLPEPMRTHRAEANRSTFAMRCRRSLSGSLPADLDELKRSSPTAPRQGPPLAPLSS